MPVALPRALVGVIRPVEVYGISKFVFVKVMVGKPLALPLPAGSPEGPPTAVDGTKTITPLNGVPVGLPAAFVGVIRPTVVNCDARVPTAEVTVGRFSEAAALALTLPR